MIELKNRLWIMRKLVNEMEKTLELAREEMYKREVEISTQEEHFLSEKEYKYV